MIEHLLKFCGSLSHKWKGWFVAPNESSIPYVDVPNTQDATFAIGVSYRGTTLIVIISYPNPEGGQTTRQILQQFTPSAISPKDQRLLKSIGALLCTYGEKIGPSIEKSTVSSQWINDSDLRMYPEGLYSRSEALKAV